MLDAMDEVRTTGLCEQNVLSPAPGRTKEQGRTLLLASTSTLLVLMAFVTPLATAGRTAVSLHSSPSTVPWLLSSMALGLTVSLLPAGAFADDLGRRKVFVTGLVLLAAGSLVCALAGGSAAFVAGRLLAGAGAGAVLACGLGLIGHAFPPGPARGHATGVWGASVGGGIATGGLLSVAADAGTSWRHTYLVVAVLAVLLGVAGRLLLVESTADVRRRPDLLGAALLGAGLASLLAALVQAKQGVGAGVLVLLAGGLALTAAFVLVEPRRAEPMLDLTLLRRRPFLAASIGSFTNGIGATALAALTPTLVQRGLGRSLLTASLLVLLFAGTSVLTALQVKRLPSRWSSRALMVGAWSASRSASWRRRGSSRPRRWCASYRGCWWLVSPSGCSTRRSAGRRSPASRRTARPWAAVPTTPSATSAPPSASAWSPSSPPAAVPTPAPQVWSPGGTTPRC